MIQLQIGSYQLKPALNVISITSSASTSSYRNNAVGVNLEYCYLFTDLEVTSSKIQVSGSYTNFYPCYLFREAPITYLSESLNTGTNLYTQFIGIQYPTVFQRAIVQDGVTIKVQNIRDIAFDTRACGPSDYVRF